MSFDWDASTIGWMPSRLFCNFHFESQVLLYWLTFSVQSHQAEKFGNCQNPGPVLVWCQYLTSSATWNSYWIDGLFCFNSCKWTVTFCFFSLVGPCLTGFAQLCVFFLTVVTLVVSASEVNCLGRLISEVTHRVSSWTLNSTHSFTSCQNAVYVSTEI